MIIGGGIAGVSTALLLGSLGKRVTLIERKETLISGPPFCHLHAGGNLYREIDDSQCLTLLRQSIEFARIYPFAIDYRPTLIAVPKQDSGSADSLLRRLKLLKAEYAKLISQDPQAKVLGEEEEYFHIFQRQDVEELAKKETPKKPKTAQEWMIPLAKHLDLDSVKYPLIMVQEFGINLFRVASGAGLALNKMPNVTIHLQSVVKDIKKSAKGFELECEGAFSGSIKASYLINATGFRSGKIDDMLGIKSQRMVEFKSAYTAYWEQREEFWPELIFHGERGTPRGMGQFTPYPAGYVQLHGMTQDITLYIDGLVSSSSSSSQPKLPKHLLKKIEQGWSKSELTERTNRAIKHLAKYLPDFANAKVGGPPLFGAQQIPGVDPTLRVAEVAFPLSNYARCEIVKVSSISDMALAILKDIDSNISTNFKVWNIKELRDIKEEDIAKRARYIAKSRAYPSKMADRCVSNLNKG